MVIKYGLIIRTFAEKESWVQKRVKEVSRLVNRALLLKLDGDLFFKRVDVLVWKDERFVSECDCGKTAEKLKQKIKDPRVYILEAAHGDLFVGILNYGVALQTHNSIDISFIISPEATNYLNEEVVKEFHKAFLAGAKVAGLAIKELRQSVMDGQIANTFAAWDNIALQTVGGFDMAASKLPKNDPHTFFMEGWSEVLRKPVYYPLAGVEEVISIARLIQLFQEPVTAPILPQGKKGRYRIPSKKTQPLYLRHYRKMGTKEQRKTALLCFLGLDLSCLKGGVMPEYLK